MTDLVSRLLGKQETPDESVAEPVPLASGANYTTKPAYVTAEQYTVGKTSMSLVTLLNTLMDYTQVPNKGSASVQSLTQHALTYSMNDTDWVVIGPNTEVVYTNALFTSTFTAAAGNSMSFAMGPDPSNQLQADLLIYTAGAAGNLDIDWGDGTTHGSFTGVAAGTTTANHIYAVAGTYTVVVTFTVSGTTVNTASGMFYAVLVPIVPNAFDQSGSMALDPGSDIGMSTSSASLTPGLPGVPPQGMTTPNAPFTGPDKSLIAQPGLPSLNYLRTPQGGVDQPGVSTAVGQYTEEEMQQLLQSSTTFTLSDETPGE